MSGQLGDLVVSLSADIAHFQTDMGKAAKTVENSAKEMTASLDAIPAMFGRIGAAAATVTAIIGGGKLFGSFVSTTKEVTAEVVKLTKAFGLQAQDASVLRIALDDAFLTVEDAIGSTDKLTQRAIKNGEAFKRAGIDIHQGNGALKDSLPLMLEVNDYLLTLKEGKERDTAAMALYGKGWRELSGILRLNSEGIKEAKARAEELHLIIGPEGIAQTKKYKQAVKDVDDVFESFKVQVGNEIIPLLTTLAVEFGENGTSAVGGFAVELKELMRTLSSVKLDLQDFSERAGIVMNGGALGSNWLSKKGRDEIKAELAAQEQMYQYSMERISERYGNSVKPRAEKTGASGRAPDMSKDASDKEKEYIDTWNKLQDKIREMNPLLSDYDKSVQKVNDEYDTLIGKYPIHSRELEHNRQVMLSWVKAANDQKTAIADTANEFKEYLRLAESEAPQHGDSGAMRLRWEEELKWLDGLQPTHGIDALNEQLATINRMVEQMPELAGKAAKAIDALLERNDSKNADRNLFMADLDYGNSPNKWGNPLIEKQKAEIEKQYQDRLKQAEDFYSKDVALAEQWAEAKDKAEHLRNKSLTDLERNTWEARAAFIGEGLGRIGDILMKGNKDQFEAGKALAIASAIVNTYMAASAAFAGITASTGGWGIALASAEAAIAVATGMAQVATIESTQYQPRAFGGPVSGGASYLVGEKGPELLTMAPGQNGYVTPNKDMGKGGGESPTIVYQISTGVSNTVRAEIMRMAPFLTQMTMNAINGNINSGGSLAQSVGRR